MAKTRGGRTLNIGRQPVQLFMYVPQLCSLARIRKLINSSPKQFLSISKCTLFSFVQIPPISHPITTGVFSSSINQPNSTSTSIKPLFLGFRSDHSMASQSSNPQSIHDFTVMTTFDVPTGDDPIGLDMSGLGKGEAWVNGQSIGLYWPTYTAPKSGCTDFCNYRGSYSSRKCLENRGKPTQQFYHVPRSWLKPSGNILVLFEDSGGSTT